MTRARCFIFFSLLLILFLTACANAGDVSTTPSPSASASKLKVAATTTIVGDVVAAVGGDAIDLHVLLPVGADAHSYQPSPQEATKLADADLVFINGLGLEENLARVLENAVDADKIVAVSDWRRAYRLGRRGRKWPF